MKGKSEQMRRLHGVVKSKAFNSEKFALEPIWFVFVSLGLLIRCIADASSVEMLYFL